MSYFSIYIIKKILYFSYQLIFQIIFISSLFIVNFAFADLKNELPANFPINTQGQSEKQNINEEKKQEAQNLSQKKPLSNKKNSLSPSKETPAQKSPATNDHGIFGNEVANHDNNAPVLFSGNHGDGSRKTGVLNLVGNAVIIQDDTTLKSNMAQIFSIPGNLPTPGTNRIQRALATGNVHIMKKATPSSPEITATGDETEFFVPERILILRGKAKVWKLNEYINGEVIKVNLISGDIDIVHPEGTIDPRSTNNTFSKQNNNANPENK